jgi:hypothetical protein
MGTFGFDLKNSVVRDTLMLGLDITTSSGFEEEILNIYQSYSSFAHYFMILELLRAAVYITY